MWNHVKNYQKIVHDHVFYSRLHVHEKVWVLIIITLQPDFYEDLQLRSLLTLLKRRNLLIFSGVISRPMLLPLWIFRLFTLQEFTVFIKSIGFKCWIIKVLLLLVTLFKQTGTLTVNHLISLLTLLTLQVFCLLTLLEHISLPRKERHKSIPV